MTSTLVTMPRTVRDVLLGDGDEHAALLSRRLDAIGVDSLGGEVAGLSLAGRAAAAGEVARAGADLLDLDLIQLLVGGWRKHRDLMAAARRTAAAPGSSELLHLVEHAITSTHRPWVDVFVGEARLSRVEFAIELRFEVRGLEATVRDGCVVMLHAGTCVVGGGLAIQGVPVDNRRVEVALPLHVALDPKIRLCGEAQPA
jgi:hypothetical protein